MTRWWPKFPSGLHVSVRGASRASRGDAIDFLDFMAAEKPGQGEVKGSRSEDQASKNEKLHNEARVDRKSGVVVSEPASDAHDASAEGDLCEGTQDIYRSERR